MKKVVVSTFLILLLACGSKTAVPKGLLPVPEMTNVLWDVMLADGLARYRYPIDTVKQFDTSVVLYRQIAQAHGTTQEQFKKSLVFYESRPDLLQIIIDSLQKRSTISVHALSDTARKRPFKKQLVKPTAIP